MHLMADTVNSLLRNESTMAGITLHVTFKHVGTMLIT